MYNFDGEAGVAKALEAKPGLILMDIQLPKIPGMEAMRNLSRGVGEGRLVLIEVLSRHKTQKP